MRKAGSPLWEGAAHPRRNISCIVHSCAASGTTKKTLLPSMNCHTCIIYVETCCHTLVVHDTNKPIKYKCS